MSFTFAFFRKCRGMVTGLDAIQARFDILQTNLATCIDSLQTITSSIKNLEQAGEAQASDEMLKQVVNINFRTRAMLKLTHKIPIQVVFACHEPAVWSMFESVYNAMDKDPAFSPLVVALPYKHPNMSDEQYIDGGMFEFCELRNINVVHGYDKEANTWLNPMSLMPDYVFFQTPYNFFPPMWSVEHISMIARICYIPYYGANLFRGAVNEIVHPISFFRFVRFAFLESAFSIKTLVNIFQDQNWFDENMVVLSGHPKLDYLTEKNHLNGKIWKSGIRQDKTRIIWTPRWNTGEGNCHFFDYKDFFVSFCKEHQDVDFTFRPHPLCIQNFLKTGELAEADLARMEMEYANSLNMTLDRSGEYQDTFLTSDILVSDISSMLLEYFAVGKPIVYTHRVDVFNELGRKLSEGFYWVRNSLELKETLEMLISGNDPLNEKRKELMAEILSIPKGSAGLRIQETIRSDFFNTSTIVTKEQSNQ